MSRPLSENRQEQPRAADGETAASDHRGVQQFPAVFNISDGSPFTTSFRYPPIPVLSAYGGGRFHQCRYKGRWDISRAVVDEADQLMRSSRCLWPGKHEADNANWDDVIFQYGPHSFLHAEQGMITGYALTPNEAAEMVSKFAKKYEMPAEPSFGEFELIRIADEDIRTESVPLKDGAAIGDDALGLHYGDGFLAWHFDFVELLKQRESGISILEGPPGTGKTSYLRHLMGVLKETHRFYFVPPATMDVLSNPAFIGFWAQQRRRHNERKFAVILEDSENAIMTRGRDNSAHVSALLNLSDGMLASFLQLQIICTINCGTGDIDQALLRPGRLLSQRLFGRLDYPVAARLAKFLGKSIPVRRDYSLAEVFADSSSETAHRSRIGFAA